MKDRFIILEADGIERIFRLNGPELTIGRHKDNTVVLADSIVSARHGRICTRGEEVLFEDMHSTNGTYVDDRLIKGGETALGDAGRIVFGRQSGPEIRYRMTDRPAAAGQKDLLFQNAYEHMRQGDFHRALACFEHLIDEGPTTPAVYYYAGYAASKMDRVDPAIMHFEQYLAVMPRDVRAMVDLGKLYERKGFSARARARYRKACELKPGDESILMRIRNLDRYEPVDDSFRQARSTEEILGSDLVETVETRHFTVTYNVARHGRRLNDALKILEETYDVLGRHLNVFPEDRVPVLLASEDGSIDAGRVDAVGSASREGIRVLVAPSTMAEEMFLNVLIVHEYVHFLIDLMNPGGNEVPWWLHEGLAQYESQNLRIDSESLVSRMLEESALIPLEVLERGIADDEIPELIQLAYAQAYSLAEYCIVEQGWDTVRRLVQGFASGRGRGAYRDAGIRSEDLEQSWQQWLKNRLGKRQAGRTTRL